MGFDKIPRAHSRAWARYVDSTDSWVYTCRPEPIRLAITRTWKPMHQVEGSQVWATDHLDDYGPVVAGKWDDYGIVVAGKWFDIEDDLANGGNEWRKASTEWRKASTTKKPPQEPPQGVTLAELLEEA